MSQSHPERVAPSTPESRSEPLRGVFGGQAWSVGEFSGIRIAIDHSWLLIAALISFSLANHFGSEYPSWGVLATWSAALVTAMLFFGSLILHELGHSLVAQRFGVEVRSITLFVFGGVAALGSEPKKPRDEILIALAGPAVSLGLALLFGTLATVVQAGGGSASELPAGMLMWLGRINWMLALFNCVPGFPLDGGRVLRGIVWATTGSFERATRYAATSGSIVAYGLILLGIVGVIAAGEIVGGLWMCFIGWFLLTAARASVGQVVFERILSGVPARQLADRVDDRSIAPSTPVESLILDAVLRRGVRTFYVVDGSNRLLGLVSLKELAAVEPDARASTRADQIMRPAAEIASLSEGDSAWAAFKQMAERQVNQLPVLEGGRLLGAVTRERLMVLIQGGLALEAERG